MILDVSITCPVREAIPNIRPKGAAADLVYATKVRKYSGLAQANRLDFKPIIFESTGHVHVNTCTSDLLNTHLIILIQLT